MTSTQRTDAIASACIEALLSASERRRVQTFPSNARRMAFRLCRGSFDAGRLQAIDRMGTVGKAMDRKYLQPKERLAIQMALEEQVFAFANVFRSAEVRLSYAERALAAYLAKINRPCIEFGAETIRAFIDNARFRRGLAGIWGA